MTIPAVVAAGDRGAARAIYGESKAFLEIEGRPLVAHVVRALQRVPEVSEVWVVGDPERLAPVLGAGDLRRELAKSLRVRQCAPVMTFCRTVSDGKSARFWKVRPMPSPAMRCGGSSRIDCPWNWMLPEEGVYKRERQLNSVVLPAPLGPIRPTILPASTSNETPSSATMPPKRTPTFCTRSSTPASLVPIDPPPSDESPGVAPGVIANCVGLSDDAAGPVNRISMESPEKFRRISATPAYRLVARAIEQQLHYPGEIKVTVVRETRAVEFAR